MASKLCAYFFTLSVVACASVYCINILYVCTVASPSHYIWNRALAYGLVQKGYNVTIIGAVQDNLPKPTNYSPIIMEGIHDVLQDSFSMNEMSKLTPFQMIKEFQKRCVFQCKKNLESKGLQQLLNYPPDFNFDLLIVDVTLGPCLYPLIQRFNYPPTVGVTAFLLPSFISFNFGNHIFPAYVPWYGLPHSTEMTFIERVWNIVFTHLDVFLRNNYEYPEVEAAAKEVFGKHMMPWNHLERHISLVLANTDPVLDYPQPLPPNIIPVGGLHTREPEQLPKDLQAVVDNAKNGVIVFSLGTNIRSDKLSIGQQRAFIEAFRRVPQTVVWKYESPIENLPENVVTFKWIPQNDILGNPNVKLFIGHGGALSTQEAIYHGVPIVSVPFILDQSVNTRMIVKKKLGVEIDINLITPSYVLGKLLEVFNDPTYYNNAKMYSRRFKDRLETPLERGIFWTEHVLRHGGADFLSNPARDMSYVKSSGADVIIFIICILLTILWVSYKMVKFIFDVKTLRSKVKIN